VSKAGNAFGAAHTNSDSRGVQSVRRGWRASDSRQGWASCSPYWSSVGGPTEPGQLRWRASTIASVPLFRRKRPQPQVPPGLPIKLTVIEDTHSYEGDDGKTYWSIGLAPVIEDTDGGHHFLRPGDPLPDSRAIYCKVAGVKHYGDALRDRRFKPLCVVKLIPEPDNPYGHGHAVGVWDSSGTVQAGHIPSELSAGITEWIRAGKLGGAVVLREIRQGSKSGPRSALHILVMPPIPPGKLEMKILDED
jgi:hypothetical protein